MRRSEFDIAPVTVTRTMIAVRTIVAALVLIALAGSILVLMQ